MIKNRDSLKANRQRKSNDNKLVIQYQIYFSIFFDIYIYLIGGTMFNKKIDSRIKLTLIFFISFFVVIFLRIVYIEMIDYKKLSSLATDLWSRDLPIEADRGLILDRNGVILADNITTTSLVLSTKSNRK